MLTSTIALAATAVIGARLGWQLARAERTLQRCLDLEGPNEPGVGASPVQAGLIA